MTTITLTVDYIDGIPNEEFTARLVKVRNRNERDITSLFLKHCNEVGLSLTSQGEIQVATQNFLDEYRDNDAVLP